MESVFLKEIKVAAAAYDAKLLASDPRFKRGVTLIHDDGSITHYDSAFLMKANYQRGTDESHWLICFTEHHGIHINHSDDLLLYWESVKMHEKIEELPT